jgi:hypothetical protein
MPDADCVCTVKQLVLVRIAQMERLQKHGCKIAVTAFFGGQRLQKAA